MHAMLSETIQERVRDTLRPGILPGMFQLSRAVEDECLAQGDQSSIMKSNATLNHRHESEYYASRGITNPLRLHEQRLDRG